MDVKIKRDTPEFRPATIEITISTREEWQALVALVDNPLDVANHVEPIHIARRDKVKNLLQGIWQAMVKNGE